MLHLQYQVIRDRRVKLRPSRDQIWRTANAPAGCADLSKQVSAKQGMQNTAVPCPCGVMDADTVVDSSNVTYTTDPWMIQNAVAKFENNIFGKRKCTYKADLTCCFSIKFGGVSLVNPGGPCVSNCRAGSPCRNGQVCASGICAAGSCAAATRWNGVMNGGERACTVFPSIPGSTAH
jgi:hypothetical protein